jgi:hypothetical protein
MEALFDAQRNRTETAAICPERDRLTKEFTSALRELVDLQNQQIHAVITHDPEFARFDILVEIALQRKREAKYALMRHLEAHGCQKE